MNNQIRKIFIIVLIMFALLGVGVTNTQFISASSLNADARNQRTILHAAETDRGPIIVDKTAIASSEREQDSKRYARSYAEGPLYAPVTGYFSSVGNASTGIEAAEEDVLDGQSQTLLGQRLRNLLTGQNRQGGGVELTLNSQMQKAAAEALGNRKGAVVALDAKTGAVLAMYSAPTFDPNQLASSVLASEHLTNQQLIDVTNRFGFGRESQIPLSVTPSVFPSDADAAQLAMSSIGQYTVQTTPLQMAQIAQTVANQGQMMTPYLIDSIVDADNQVVRTTSPTDGGRPISAETASKLRTMMEAVVSQPYGTGNTMALPNVAVAAKTGTAETGEGNRANAWAIGFAPADNPQIAFAVLVEGDDTNPTPHGGDVAGPVARAVLEAGLK